MLRRQAIVIDLGDTQTYHDLDGVHADYAAGMRKLGYDVSQELRKKFLSPGTGHPLKREMYEKIKGTDFFRWLPIMPGAVDMYRALKSSREPVILTASPLFGATEDNYYLNPYWQGAKYHKRGWVEHIFLPQTKPYEDFAFGMRRTHYSDHIAIADENFICTTSKRKHEFLHHKHSTRQLLIDDKIENVSAWAEAGGLGILHLDPETTLRAAALLSGQDFGLEGPGEWKRYGSNGGFLFDARVPE